MNVLGIVPCRAGSKRLSGKNRLVLGGMELWAIAMGQALLAGCGRVCVTTNDREILGQIGMSWAGVSGRLRPENLCQDDSPVEAAVLDALEATPNGDRSWDAVCLLNPTHPLREAKDIRECILDVIDRGFPSSALAWADYRYTLAEGAALSTLNQQDRIPRVVVSGECYVVRTPAFLETGKLIVCGNVSKGFARRSQGAQVDIDTEEDFLYAQALWNRRTALKGDVLNVQA